MYRVDLWFRVQEALAELPEQGRQEVMEVIAATLVRPGSWPVSGGLDTALRFGPRTWVRFCAYPDGIEVVGIGWVG